MRILHFDTTAYAPTSPLFLEALSESGHEFMLFDEAPYVKLLGTSLVHRIAYRIRRRRPLTWKKLNMDFLEAGVQYSPDLVFVDKGRFLAADTLRAIKRATGAFLVNFAPDDPFNPVNSTRDLLEALPVFDLYVTTKTANMQDLRDAGCRSVEFVPFAYKPSVHYPEQPRTVAEEEMYSADVTFVGTYDRDREKYLRPLLERLGRRCSVWGGGWDRCEWVGESYRGMAIGRGYRLALSCSKISLGLLRKANRDQSTTRTFEIPACGGVLLAERTAEHAAFFREGEEAEFFGSPEELLEKTEILLGDPDRRQRLADAGLAAVRAGGNTYSDRLRQILAYQRCRS